MRLFDCACAREIWHLLTDAISREAVEISERYADQQATFAELDSIHQKAFAVARSQRKDPFNDAGWAACSCSISRSALSSAYDKASGALAKELSKKAPVREAHRAVTSARQTRLVRCIFGNP
ncbi:hypothetical protein [Zavarzinella formosa]|uniref:hypothetical protein n=1 Tax=Zavarzinella formosa TaxID=360055 RepID=UPI0012FA4F1F|nr:hypothetical protein [Zavarzinella formosa]